LFRHIKIILTSVLVVVLSFGIVFSYSEYQEYKLNEFVSKIDVSLLGNDVLYVETIKDDVMVSIDTIVFKLELEKLAYNVSPKIKINYLKLERYSNDVIVKYTYKNKSKVVKYSLQKGVEKKGD